jgi:hypothetical protein
MFFIFLFYSLDDFFHHVLCRKSNPQPRIPWALNASFLMLFALGLPIAARFGQHKGKEEMLKLRRFAEESTLQFEKK